MHACLLSGFSCIQLFAPQWTVAHQAPLSVEFSKQAYWSGLPCPPPRGLLRPRDRTRVSYVSCIGRRVLYHQHHLGSPRLSSAPILMLLPAPRLPVFVKLKGSVKKTQKAGVIIHKVLDVVEGALEPYGWAGISVLALTS